MAGDTPFRELIARVRTGDEEAATELVGRYGDDIRRVVRVRLVGQQNLRRLLDSMDVCQSVLASFFVRAALGQYDLDTPENLVALLGGMAHNKVIDQARRQKAGRRDPGVLDAADPDEVAGRSPSPSRCASYRELLERFRAGLSPEERRLVDLRSQGRGWAEIAAEVGGTADAARVRHARLTARAARELGLEDGCE